MTRKYLGTALLGSLLCLWAQFESASAHPLDPALLELRESENATIDVLWRIPAALPAGSRIEPVFPDRCAPLSSPRNNQTGPRITARWQMRCGSSGLVGQQIGIGGLRERRTDALVRIVLSDGRLIQTVLRGDTPFLVVPERTDAWFVLRDYLALGFEHILTGLDHLMFVLGLTLLVQGCRRLIWTITAFTVGHSMTLSLAVLGYVEVSPAPVEALIALSIFAVAVEITREAQGCTSGWWRCPWAMALVFGFLHGLGFAGALAEVGLPADEIPLALFSFNVGIEVGQILFVGLVLAGTAILRVIPVPWPKASKMVPAYTIGSLSALWIFERVYLIFGV
jgi:hydrogenase/urease accessory protein HupE